MKKYNVKFRLIGLLLITLFVSSCRSHLELNYMKDIDGAEIHSKVLNTSTKIQAGDQLGIWISALDMESVASFNQNFSRMNTPQFSPPSGNIPQTQNMGGEIPTYMVSTKGTINFPVLGELVALGLTLEELEAEIQKKMTKYVNNPSVQARILNYKITVLGQVARPGTFTIPDNQATILSALGMAGDLTNFALRENVLLVRNENGKIVNQRIDLTSKDFINSPYYFLKQNDVIYVNSNKTIAKQSKLNPNNGLYLSVASITVAIMALFLR